MAETQRQFVQSSVETLLAPLIEWLVTAETHYDHSPSSQTLTEPDRDAEWAQIQTVAKVLRKTDEAMRGLLPALLEQIKIYLATGIGSNTLDEFCKEFMVR